MLPLAASKRLCACSSLVSVLASTTAWRPLSNRYRFLSLPVISVRTCA